MVPWPQRGYPHFNFFIGYAEPCFPTGEGMVLLTSVFLKSVSGVSIYSFMCSVAYV